MYLQKALGDDSLGDLREALLEVLQDVVVELSASLRHPGPARRVNEPTYANAPTTVLFSSPTNTHRHTLQTESSNVINAQWRVPSGRLQQSPS